jgi:DNA-binding CsgD family transcriptional regulator
MELARDFDPVEAPSSLPTGTVTFLLTDIDAAASAWQRAPEVIDLDAAVAYALRARGQRKRPSTGWDSLTPTELQVVGQVAAGRTNAEIAAALLIGRTTVKTHLAHIFTKLDLTNRGQLAAEAARRGSATSA